MSLRRKLLAMKADWEKWENRISIAVAVFFAGAVIANAGLFFSVRKTPSFFGAAFSWLYAVSWFPAAQRIRQPQPRYRPPGPSQVPQHKPAQQHDYAV